MSRFLVIGGHGKVARLLTPLLVQGGHQVTALFRNPAHEDDVIADGATPVVFDIEHAQTDAIAAQLAGHDAVVWSAGAGGGDAARTYAVDRDAAIRSMHAAEQARVRRYVMVSYLGAGLEHGIGQTMASSPMRRPRPLPMRTCAVPRWTGPSSAPAGSRWTRPPAASPATRAAMPTAASRGPTWRR
ncbi:UNVERIFIED_ORG: nucleoside-diphosphate-sugar epimerase [Xanthomonas axonopodis]